MVFLIKAAQLILSLSILVVLHELGHYIPAKLFKTKVEKFYLFFDYKFSLFKKKIGDTEWGIGWIPFGGYVKIAGMIDESMDKDQLKKEPEPWEFRAKPAWQRLIIMIGGVTVNLILGIVIYAMVMFTWGRDILEQENLTNGLAVHEYMEQFGFQNGDIIDEMEGQTVSNVLDINRQILLYDATHFKITHSDGITESITLPESIDMDLFKAGILTPFTPRTTSVIDTIIEGKLAAEAGLLKGDSLAFVNEKNVGYWNEFTQTLQSYKDSVVNIEFYRNNELKSTQIQLDSTGLIGLGNKGISKSQMTHLSYSLTESIPEGVKLGLATLNDYIKQMKFLFTSKGASSVGGFGAIGGMFSPTWNWHSFWLNTAFISIVLAFMNILPIPALDGGHIMFLLYEMITGRKPNEKILEYAQIAGMILLLALLLFANGNDIFRFFK